MIKITVEVNDFVEGRLEATVKIKDTKEVAMAMAYIDVVKKRLLETFYKSTLEIDYEDDKASK